eukprot:764155-Hanusia_phi.AAC.5
MPSHKQKALKEGTLSMSAIEQLLQSKPFREATWERLGLPLDLQMPNFDGQLLYGKMSEMIHSTQGPFVYLSNDTSAVEIVFFREVCALFGRDVDIFDREHTELGKTLQRQAYLDLKKANRDEKERKLPGSMLQDC